MSNPESRLMRHRDIGRRTLNEIDYWINSLSQRVYDLEKENERLRKELNPIKFFDTTTKPMEWTSIPPTITLTYGGQASLIYEKDTFGYQLFIRAKTGEDEVRYVYYISDLELLSAKDVRGLLESLYMSLLHELDRLFGENGDRRRTTQTETGD